MTAIELFRAAGWDVDETDPGCGHGPRVMLECRRNGVRGVAVICDPSGDSIRVDQPAHAPVSVQFYPGDAWETLDEWDEWDGDCGRYGAIALLMAMPGWGYDAIARTRNHERETAASVPLVPLEPVIIYRPAPPGVIVGP